MGTVTLKVLKKYTGLLMGKHGQMVRQFRDGFKVYVKIDSQRPGRFTYVTFTGEVGGVYGAVHHVGWLFHYHRQFRSDNSEAFSSIDEKYINQIEVSDLNLSLIQGLLRRPCLILSN